MAKTAKIVTFSMDERTIKRLDELQTMMHIPNKSGILSRLIDKEYSRQLELREESSTI